MAILRDILARFAVSVDDSPLSKLDKRINVVKANIARMAGYAATGFAAAGYAAYQLVDAASHADESLNVLRQTFKGNSDAVIAWSKTLGAEMGRSEYTLQDAAGRFGAFLGPVFKDSGMDIADMSQKLSALAVDLASFYNTSDAEAQMRLFSGMSGETEAVRRLGIDISDTSLDDLNKKNGDRRRLASLTLAEKSALRYQKILIDTVDKQNDAVRTAGGWANSLKRVQERVKTISVEFGRKLIPMALKVLAAIEKVVNGAVKGYDLLTHRTHALEVALGLATLALGRFAYQQAALVIGAPGFLNYFVAMAGAATKAAMSFARLALTFLVIEDFVGFLRGHKSVFGDFLTEVTGMQQPLEAFRDVMEDIAAHTMRFINGMKKAAFLISSTGMSGADVAAGLEAIDKETPTPEQNARRRDESRQGQWRQAIESGNFKGITKFREPLEAEDAAKERALRDRRTFLLQSPDRATQNDYANSLAAPRDHGAATASEKENRASKTWTEAKASMRMPEQVISSSKGSAKGPSVNIGQITINSQTAEEGFERSLRQAYSVGASAAEPK